MDGPGELEDKVVPMEPIWQRGAMDAILAKPTIFTSLASHLYAHRLAAFEQVSKSVKTSSRHAESGAALGQWQCR